MLPNNSAPAAAPHILLGLSLLLSLSACVFVQQRYPSLPPGPYRGVLELVYNPIIPNPKGAPLPEKVNLEFEEVTGGQLPFNFEVVYDDDTTFHIVLHNGEEKILVPAEDIHTGRDQSIGRDTLRIDFPVYDTHISAYHEENVIEGVWVVHYRDNYRIPFKAYFGEGHRFTPLRKAPAADLTGSWAVTFAGDRGEDAYPGIAEFTQDGNELRGTFRTETGDYRYLEGTVQDNKAYLSVFDGSHAFLFEALIKDDGSLAGTFRSGYHYVTEWTATRDPDASLTDPNALTRLRDREAPLSFAFPTPAGDTVRLDDFDGPKLVQLFGTWCPNCRDETNFLKEYLAEHDPDVQLIGLAFERYGADDPRSHAAVERYRERMEVDWPILLAGSSDKRAAGRALPMLDRVLSFPTLLFVDADNQVRRIHTGFNGPATSKYAEFKEAFATSIEDLIAREQLSAVQ